MWFRNFARIIPLSAIVACQSDLTQPPVGSENASVAFAKWTPSAFDTCTQAQHDQYGTVGPDGKMYPKWHPPVDPASGCSFGHDHGRDPSGSDLFSSVGDIPLGYSNEQLDIFDPSTSRHEDHVGHKIEWENDIEMRVGGGVSSSLFSVTCDLLTKLHQGTHSKDAFTNNLHELVYHVECSDGTKMSLTMMAAIGTPGQFRASCDRGRVIQVGPASPVTSPDGGGHRSIPDRQCINQNILVAPGEKSSLSSLRESWEISQSIRTSNGKRLAHINPYYQVFTPSRFFDPAMPDNVGRPIDLCYEVGTNGERVNNELCDVSTASGALLTVAHDDPQSRFNGAHRFVDINSNDISNEDGPNVWFTDPFGKNASPDPFPGSVRQFIASMDNERLDLHGPQIGRDRDYGGPGVGVHPPN